MSLCSRCHNPSRFTLCYDCVAYLKARTMEELHQEHRLNELQKKLADAEWERKRILAAQRAAENFGMDGPPREPKTPPGFGRSVIHGPPRQIFDFNPPGEYECCKLPAPDSFIADLCNAIEGRDGIVRWGV